MLAIAASRLSPSDTWRRKNEKTKERPILGSWRERRGSKESGEEKGSGETKETLGSWRLRKRERTKAMDETGVHGDCIPAEWKLQKMYKQLKIDNNMFTTWLVESVYPCGRSLSCSESLPPCITLSRKQAKGEQARLGSDIERHLDNVHRPSQIRHHCQQHHRACAPNTEDPREHDGSP